MRKVWRFGNRSDARQAEPELDQFVPGAGPDFICIGAQKAGTTWLYNQLAVHPDFWMPPRKEIHYFNDRGHRPKKTWWRTQDERDLRFRKKLQAVGAQPWLDLTNYGQLFVAKGSLISGDITPAYCMLPDEIIAMVVRQFPAAKVIFLARDPVERAWSQISMSVRKGGRAPFDVNDPAEVVRQLLHPLVVPRSHPAMIVARWRRHVAPGQFGLFFFDDLKNQPAALRRSIIAFLGGDPDKGNNRLRPEDNRNPGKTPPLSGEVQVQLARFFARELRACATELGGPATEWPAVSRSDALACKGDEPNFDPRFAKRDVSKSGFAFAASNSCAIFLLLRGKMDIRLLLVPYDSGQRNVRMGAGPEHLRAAGLEKHLAAQGHQVDSEVIEPASLNWRAEVQTSFELMRAVAVHVRAARTAEKFPVVLSGNCLAAVGVIAGLGAGTGVLWIDAHGDFNTPQTTTSGFLDGMTLATATGQCWVELARSIEGFQPVPDNAVVLLGARDLDPGEASALARSQITRLSVEASKTGLAPVLQSIGPMMERFYVHLDLDALDPSVGRANSYSARGGFLSADLETLLSTVAEHLPVEALTISSYDPSYDIDGAVCAAAFQASAALLAGVGSTHAR